MYRIEDEFIENADTNIILWKLVRNSNKNKFFFSSKRLENLYSKLRR
jgi:hypothetical protein